MTETLPVSETSQDTSSANALDGAPPPNVDGASDGAGWQSALSGTNAAESGTGADATSAEVDVIQVFKPGATFKNGMVLYQVRDEQGGGWQLRMLSADAQHRREPDMLVLTSDQKLTREDFGREGSVWTSVLETKKEMEAEGNVLPREERASGTVGDFAAGATIGWLSDTVSGVASIPESFVRSAISLGATPALLAEEVVDAVRPGDQTKTGGNNPLNREEFYQFGQDNVSAEAIAQIEKDIAASLNVDTESHAYNAGAFGTSLSFMIAGYAKGKSGSGSAPRIGGSIDVDTVTTQAATAPVSEIVKGVSRVSDTSLGAGLAANPKLRGVLRARLQNNPTTPGAQRTLRRIDAVSDANAGTGTTAPKVVTQPGSAITPQSRSPKGADPANGVVAPIITSQGSGSVSSQGAGDLTSRTGYPDIQNVAAGGGGGQQPPRTVPLTDADGGENAVDVLLSNRATNLSAGSDGRVDLAVPDGQGGVTQHEGITVADARTLAEDAAAGIDGLTADDILVNANGILSEGSETVLNRQSEVVWQAPESIVTGVPRELWPEPEVPQAMRLTDAQIENVVTALEDEGGFRQRLAQDPIAPQLDLIANGDINEALYDVNPRFFRAAQVGKEQRLMTAAAESGDVVELFTVAGPSALNGSHRFSQYRADADGNSYPPNTTLIATRQRTPDGSVEITGPYQTLLDNIEANIDDYNVLERGADGDWAPVAFETPDLQRQAAEDVLSGADEDRAVSMGDGAGNDWLYQWGDFTRAEDHSQRGMGGWSPDLGDKALIGVPPDVTPARTAESLQTVQDLVSFGARYENGAAENGIVALLTANVRALPMVTDRSQASNTLTNAVVLGAAREVVLGNATTESGNFYDLNLAPLSMPMEDALVEQIERTPLIDATSGHRYSPEERQAALETVVEDLRVNDPVLYEAIFGTD